MKVFVSILVSLSFVGQWFCNRADAGGMPTPIISSSGASRIKDLTTVEGARSNQLVGYGLIVGLAGSGDSKVSYTIKSVANALQRFGIKVPEKGIKSGNVAAVMVTADIEPFARPGSRMDVTVSSLGDAESLEGGVLLQTPLRGADDVVYSVAQGAVAVGGFLQGIGGPGGATVQKNHPTVGLIANGAIVERAIPAQVVSNGSLNLLLRDPDFTSAARMAERINQMFPASSLALDSSTVNVKIPPEYTDYEVNFIATIGSIEVDSDVPARIIINERTGTIIATSTVRISTVAVSHGSLTIRISSDLSVSQPEFLSEFGRTVVTPSTQTDVEEQKGSFVIVEDEPTIERITAGLNALGVSTRDMMAIFQTMKRAGALHAELVIN